MKDVCVIGAGASGLVAAKHALELNLSVTVYEQTDKLGGIWVYTDETNCHTSMYADLKTNLTKETMMFEDFPYPEHLPSFLNSQNILDYLVKYAEGLPIKFNHTVKQVVREDQKWRVTVDEIGTVSSFLYDIVFVCNGHFFDPRIPLDYGRFKGRILHSHDYRRASEFRDQKVLVIGAGPSGIDVALQLAEQNAQVIMISRKAVYKDTPTNIVQIVEHVEEITEHGAITTSGIRIGNIDTIIFCTGYNIKFPFLSSDIIEIKADNQMLSPLYEHAVHARYPQSLYFIGLFNLSITFPLFELQVRMALSFALEKTPLPSQDELDSFEAKWMKHQAEHGLDERRFHELLGAQWEYAHRINQFAYRQYKSEYIEFLRKMLECIYGYRKKSHRTFRDKNYRVDLKNLTFELLQ